MVRWLNFVSLEAKHVWLQLELLEHLKKIDIAFCGYHGWHDWYLATNMSNKKNLDKQLLPGLKLEVYQAHSRIL